MIYLLSQYWISVALAIALGLFVGRSTRDGSAEGDAGRGVWLGWAVAIFLAGVFVAAFKWLPGLAGHALEVALLLFAGYVIGCVAGCGGRGAANEASADAHGHATAAH